MQLETIDYVQLLKENEIMREVLDSDLACICIKDMDGCFLYVNRNDAALYNVEPKDLIGKTVEPYVGRKQFLEWLDHDNAVIRGGKPVHIEPYVRHDLSGHKRWFDTVKIPLTEYGQSDRLLIIHRDMTILKEAQEQNEKLNMQLFQSQRMEAVGTLAAGVAHNFNNLMMTILALTNKLEDEIQGSKDALVYLEQIDKSIRHASEITRHLLSYANQRETETKRLDLTLIIDEVENLIRPGLSSRITFKKESCLEPLMIWASRSELLQVFINLLINAEESIKGKGQISLSVSRTAQEGAITISDTGCGIEARVLTKIFDPFFTTKEVGKGTGLGLYYAYNVINKYGGTIHVSSQPGEGATFHVTFPLLAELL